MRDATSTMAQRVALLALGFVTAFSACTKRSELNKAAEVGSSVAGGPQSAAASTQSASTSTRSDGIDAAVRARAGRLGRDPSTILRWVASDIGNDLYAGVLRGARGTLLARTGNSADKALLLRDLVRASNPTAELRFASGLLAADQIDDLTESARTYRPTRPRLVAEVASEIRNRSGSGDVQAALGRLAQLWQTATAEARDETKHLVNLLDQRNVALAPASLSKAKRQSLLARHVWLQIRESDGAWTDLDPTFPNAAPGKTRCKPAAMFAELPSDQYALLTIKARIEERQNGALQSRYAIERSWRIADLADSSISFLHAEPMGLAVPSSTPPAPKGAWAYTPVVRVGTEDIVGRSFFLPIPASASKPGVSLDRALGRIGSVFGGGEPQPQRSAPAEQRPATLDVEATGSWLEITTKTADGWQETLESPLFDRIGYGARRAGQPTAAQLAPLAEVEGEYAPLAMMLSVVVWTGAPTATAVKLDTAKIARERDLNGLAAGLNRLHRAYYRLRRAAFDSMEPAKPVRVVAWHPSVSVLGVGVEGDAQHARFRMDLTSDHSQPLVEDRTESRPASMAAAWAVSSVMSERLLVNSGAVLVGQPAPASTDVVSIFAAARQAQMPFQLLRPADASGIQALPVSPEARARMEARLAAGRTLLIPAGVPATALKPNFGWWEINLEDGRLRDEMEDGRHGQAGGEYAGTNQVPARSAPWWHRLGCAVVFGTALGIASFEAYEGIEEGVEQGTEVILTEFERNKKAEEIIEEIDKGLKGCR